MTRDFVMRIPFKVLFFAFSMVFWVANAALSQSGDGRVALVIGNSAYSHVSSLKNPSNDATEVGAALKRLGFDVTVAINLNGSEVNQQLGSFARKANQANIAILYYAGHGVEIDNRNFVLPVDADIRSVSDVEYQATELPKLLNAVRGAKDLRLVLLDACRDNPFQGRTFASSRSLGRGLAVVEPPAGVLVGYAARGGTVAADGDGENSPYATAILNHIEEPGLEIGKLFRRIRDQVYQSTDGRQEPFTYGSLPAKDIFLAGQRASGIIADFASAETADTIEAWDAFLGQYQDESGSQPLVNAARRLRASKLSQNEPPELERQTLLAPEQDTLPENRLQEFTFAPQTPEEQEAALNLSKEDYVNVQKLLKSLGFYSAALDGQFGQQSRAALENFQTFAKLTVTGYLNDSSVERLLDTYAAAPNTWDGQWKVSLLRRLTPNVGRSGAGLISVMSELTLHVTGRKVELLNVVHLSQAAKLANPSLKAEITQNGALHLSAVMNYDPFKSVSRRVFGSMYLPERVPVGRSFDIPSSRLDSVSNAIIRIRRLPEDGEDPLWFLNKN